MEVGYSKARTYDDSLYVERYTSDSFTSLVYDRDNVTINYVCSEVDKSKDLSVIDHYGETIFHIELNDLGLPIVYGSSVDDYFDIDDCFNALNNWKINYVNTNCAVGVVGASWLNGISDPSNVLGDTGDYYVNTTSWDVFEKVAGIWTLIGNIKGGDGTDGVDGENGSKWYNGEGAPGSLIGVEGDYYLNIVNGDVYAKSGGTWAVVANIGGENISSSVIQLEDFSSFPVTGNSTKIYIDTSTNIFYYWDGAAYKKEGSYDSDFTVYLNQTDGFKTFMKWKNGEVVPAAGKHPKEILQLGAVEAIPPNATLTTSTTIAFNQTSISNVLNFTKSVNLPGTSILSTSLEFRRNGAGAWTAISTNTGLTTYTHVYTDSVYNTASFDYRYIVTDDLGGTVTKTVSIPITAYVAPSVSFSASQGTSREKGNTVSTFTGTVTRNSPNVLLTSYIIEYQVNGAGGWIEIGTATSISGASASISVSHNDGGLSASNSLVFRVKVIDGYQTTYSSSYTISFYTRSVLGYSQNNSLSLSDITAINTNIALTNSKSRTISGITATVSYYTYYVYEASAGDLSNVIMDGSSPVLGAFTKLTDVSGNNAYGASVTYRIYKSNATNAFSSNTLTFS